MDKSNTKAYLYAIIVALGPLSFGLTMGFTSPAISEWTGSKKTNYQNWDVFSGVSSSAITWFNAIASLFGCVGPFIIEWLVKFMNSRMIICILCTMITILWGCHFAISPDLFYFGIFIRALTGLAVGGISTVCPVMLIELAPEGHTGFVGTFNQMAIVIGIVCMNLAGNWLSWRSLVIIGIICAALPAFLIWLCPETYTRPAKEEKKDSEKDSDDDENSLNMYEQEYFDADAKRLESIEHWDNLSQVLIGIMLMFFQQFAGINALITDLDKNFLDAGVSIDPGVASSLTSGAQLIGCIISGILIDRGNNRKIFTMISHLGCTLMLIFMAFNTWWNWAKWFPIVVIFIYMFSFCIAVGPYPWYYVVERLSTHEMRIIGQARISNFNWFFSFMIIFLNPALVDFIGQEWTQILYAGFSALGALYGYFYVKPLHNNQ